jgi:hypothetical protein
LELNPKKMRQSRVFSAAIVAGIAMLLLSYQNCSPGFDVLKTDLASMTLPDSSQLPEEVPPDVIADPGGPLSVFVRNVDILQGGSLNFKVELNRASTVPVVVKLESVQGTAIPLVDYEPVATSVTIPAGSLSVMFEVPSLVFDIATTGKTMGLRATASSAGTILQPTGIATIRATQKEMLFSQISSALYGLCGLSPLGTVFCWGNGLTRTSSGTVDTKYVATEVLGLAGVKSIFRVDGGLCAISATGMVKCVGPTEGGYFGNGAKEALAAPTEIANLAGSVKLAFGSWISCE